MRTFARSAVAFTLALMLSAVYLAFRAAHAQQNCVTAPNGVVAWYPFDGNGYDVQGGNHATLTGGPAFAAGKVGQALQFDGADDSAKAPSSPGLNVGAGGGMTVALWINPAETNSRPLVEWNSGVISGCEFCPIGTHFWIAQSNNGAPGMLFANLIKVEGGNQVIQSDPGIITPNTYQHVALTYDKASGVARLYRNGVVVAEQSNLGSFTPQTSFDLYFGFRPAGSGINSRYKGAMDEAQIFNRALPQADIQTIFNATALCRQQSLQFLSGTLAVNEASGAATLAVRRRGELTGTATVQYATTANGTATPNADYTTVSGTLTFAEGEATKTITIPINVDAITEPDETFQVTLSNPTGGAALSTPTTETVTIVDPRSTTQLGRILTSTGASQGGIIEFNTDGSNTTNLTANTFDGGCNVPPYKDSNPSVSRDGKRIAFISNRDLSGPGRQPRIFVMNSDGSDVRQLTFNVAEGNFQADQVRDLNPVISPDGTRVAFISNRAVETVTPNNGTSYQVRPNDIYVVNTDGTNLRRVTGLQKNANGDAASNIVSVAWSPDGTTLAFYGIRSRQIEDPPGTKRIVTEQGVFSVSAGGSNQTNDTIIGILCCTTGLSDSLDWSPDGRYIGILWGGEAQGAPPRRVIIYDLQTLIDGKPARGDLLQGAGLNLTGLLRFSPDSQRFVVGHITDFNFSQGVLTFVGVNGSGRTDVKVPGWNPYDPIWWQPGAPIPAPERMEVTPDPITVWAGKSVQMTPTLFDAQGNVIVRAAGAWRTSCFNGSASVSHTGLVTGSTNINYTDQVCAFNAGLSACSVLQNFDIPILSVSATKPEANKSGAGGPGVFTIRRAGNPSGALVIAFTLSGSASRDTDYTLDATGGTISGNTLTLPPNQTSATVNIRPLSNSPGKGDKSVIITIQPDPANAYFINNQSNTARVVLRDDSLPTLSCAPKPSGLANWYRAEDDAKDSAGSRHGTLQGGAGFAQGLVGQAFSLDGKDDYVDLGSLSPGSQWTVEAWVKPSATPSGRRAILGGFGDCNDWGITMENGQIGVVVKPPSGCTQTVSSGVAATPGAWSHVVATNDGKTARIYVNGLERASGAVAANYVGYAASVRVGSEACCGNFFPGLIDEASIYSRALTSSEVQSIYAADRAGKCTTATPPLSLSAVTPDKGGDAGSVTVTIYGQSIKPGATVRLRRSGFADITGTGVSVASGGTFLTASFDLANKAQGAWDVVVTNPDNATAALSAAFTVEASRPAQVWVDVVGRYTVRSNQTQTFYIAYGNSGDVDADATMIRVEIPQPLSVAQLPQLEDGSVPALTVNDALSIIEFYVPKVAANSAKALPMMLRTPDSLGHENVQLLAWAVSSQGLADLAAIRPNPNLTITPQILEATNTPTSVVLKFNLKLGPTQDDVVHNETSIIETDVERAPEETITENGDNIEVVSKYWVRLPANFFDATQSAPTLGQPGTTSESSPSATPSPTPYKIGEAIAKWQGKKHKLEELRTIGKTLKQVSDYELRRQLRIKLINCLAYTGQSCQEDPSRKPMININLQQPLLSQYDILLGNANAYQNWHILDNTTGIFVDDSGTAKIPVSLVKKAAAYIADDTQGEWADNLATMLVANWNLPKPAQVNSNGIPSGPLTYVPPHIFQAAQDKSNAGRQKLLRMLIEHCFGTGKLDISVGPEANPSMLLRESSGYNADDFACSPGKRFKKTITLNIVFSQDPNEKVGPQGAGTARHVKGIDPINYAVFFENKAEATAPAQTVVITDQLDASKLDLNTFSFGVFTFGSSVATALPGLSSYTTDVDLRPAKNLITRVNAQLDKSTGLLTWRFTSIDPATGQPTTDPLAGFLPPNKKSPEGQGSVTFSVMPKANLTTGTEIRNKARIVFDQNAPIDTPEWLNTIDKSLPTSRASTLASAQPFIIFQVNWSGTDTGSGVRDYTVYVSENGGPYTIWLTDTTDTSAYYVGQPGKTYSFYTLATDNANNHENAKTTAETMASTPSNIQNSLDDARFFVWQHYLDFLSRTPDEGGLGYWTSQLTDCGADQACLRNRRIGVSNAFFFELEYQQTASYVFRLYRAAYGNNQPFPNPDTSNTAEARKLPSYAVFSPDRSQVVGGAGLSASQLALANNFVQRAEFLQKYPASLTGAQFVDAVLTTIKNDSGADLTSQRTALINLFNSGGRGAVMYRLADDNASSNPINNRAFVDAEYNRAFVYSQYAGYLKRDADIGGFGFWLGQVNRFPLRSTGIQNAMVCSFITSAEYQLRFGSTTTHSNKECPQ